jgi:DNA-binding NarL/FixJ family response regulator
MNPLHILVGDDYEIVRRGLVSLRKSHAGWDVCGEAQDGREAGSISNSCPRLLL